MALRKKSSRRGRAKRRVAEGESTSQTQTQTQTQTKDPDCDLGPAAASSCTPAAESFRHISSSNSVGKMILDAVSEGIYCLDLDGVTTFANPAAALMTGWEAADLVGILQHELIHHSYANGEAYPVDVCPIYMALRDGCAHSREDEVFWRRDGSSFPVSYTSTPIFIGGVLAGAIVSFQDISERIRRDRWQSTRNSVFRNIAMHRPLDDTLQMLADAYAAYDTNCSIAFLLCDDTGQNKLVLVAGSRLPLELEDELRVVAIEGGASACGRAAILGNEIFVDASHADAFTSSCMEIAVASVQRCLALPMVSANGQPRGVAAFFHTTSAGLAAAGEKAHQMPAEDIEYAPYRAVRDMAQIAVETRRLHSSLVHQAEHDQLTDLPNRLLFEDCLNHGLRAADLTGQRVAVCLIDIDRFRRVNENYGHVVGDELLQQISDRLQHGLRRIDVLGRESGDEFLILLPELASAAEAEVICNRLLLALAAPFAVQGHSIVISASAGFSMYPEHGSTPEALIQNADTAAEHAKEEGHATIQMFRPDFGAKARQLAAREAALRTALERNELYLMYQPLYDSGRRVHGFEALLRWNSPDLGMIPPDQFIPLAESTGFIIPIGAWVLQEACRQAMAWKAEALKGTKVFVNVSALQLGQEDFTQTVSKALELSGLPPSRLELEVTESLIVPSFRKATARLQPLQDLGVSIAIDDFGTGHSSFGVLHKLPINAIKIDRSFISRIDRDPSGLSTVRTIVDLVRQLGMKTVGEGVETEEQFRLLHEMHCDYFQGFLFSRPLTPEAAHLLFEGVPPHPMAEISVNSEDLKVSA